MASGHVNSIKGPNTWLHRPMLQNVKKALANSEPSTHGTFAKCRLALRLSAYRGSAEVNRTSSTERDARGLPSFCWLAPSGSYSSDRFRTTARPKPRRIERPSGCKTPGRARWWRSAELLGIFSRYGASIRVSQLPREQSGDVGRRAWGREHVSLDLVTAEFA